MNTRTDNIVFNLLVNEIENKESNSGAWGVDEKESGIQDAADDWTKHWDEEKEEGNEAERYRECNWKIEDESDDKNAEHSHEAIK